MAVRVPTLQRIQPSRELPSNDRINFNAPNQANDIIQTTNSVASLGSEVVQVFKEAEDAKINQISQEVGNEYSLWKEGRLSELKKIQGDPTDAYAAFENEEREKFEEIMTSREGLSSRVKDHLGASLGKLRNNSKLQVMRQQGLQQEIYSANLHESTIKIKKNDLIQASSYVDASDSSTLAPFDQSVTEIRNLNIKRGLENKTVKILDKDEQGNLSKEGMLYIDDSGEKHKISMDNIAKQKIAKDLSDGISRSIDAVIGSGDLEKAKILKERYNDYIDPRTKKALNSSFNTVQVKQEAVLELSKLSGTPEEKLKGILKIKNFEVQTKALQIHDARERDIQAIRDRQHKSNGEALMKDIMQKQTEGKGYSSFFQFQESELFKRHSKLSSSDVKKMKDLIEPKRGKTSLKAMTNMQNLLEGNHPKFKIEEMSPEDFQLHFVSQLRTQPERNKYNGVFERARGKEPSNSEYRASLRSSKKFLEEKLQLLKVVRKVRGKFKQKDELILLEHKLNLEELLDTDAKGLSREDLRKYINRYAISVKERETFNPVPVSRRINQSLTNDPNQEDDDSQEAETQRSKPIRRSSIQERAEALRAKLRGR